MHPNRPMNLKELEDRLAEIKPVEPGEEFVRRAHRIIDQAGVAPRRHNPFWYPGLATAAMLVVAVLFFSASDSRNVETVLLDGDAGALLIGQVSPHTSADLQSLSIEGTSDSSQSGVDTFEGRFAAQCQGCHTSETSGAPFIETATRMREVIVDYLQRSGVCSDCSESQVEQAMDMWMPGRSSSGAIS